jgi:hypothetical protein
MASPTVKGLAGRIFAAFAAGYDSTRAAHEKSRLPDGSFPPEPSWFGRMSEALSAGTTVALKERDAIDFEFAAMEARCLEASLEARIWKDMAKDIIAVVAATRAPAESERRSGHVDGTDGAA